MMPPNSAGSAEGPASFGLQLRGVPRKARPRYGAYAGTRSARTPSLHPLGLGIREYPFGANAVHAMARLYCRESLIKLN
jgi:hypothetical protein